MPFAIGMEQQIQVRGGDGTILWTGTALAGTQFWVTNSDSAAFTMDEGVLWDPLSTGSLIPRLETTAAGATPASDLPQTLAIKGKRIAALADVAFIGVCNDPIGVGKVGLVLGNGSVTTVKTTTVNIPVGRPITGSATAGLASGDATPLVGEVLGMCIKTNDTVANNGTGSTSFAGVLVSPR